MSREMKVVHCCERREISGEVEGGPGPGWGVTHEPHCPLEPEASEGAGKGGESGARSRRRGYAVVPARTRGARPAADPGDA